MSRPKIVMHNSVSLDGSFVGFEVNIGRHYEAARAYWTKTTLIGLMHNSVSLDGSSAGFGSDVGQHQGVVRASWTKMMLTGSRTVVTGIETYQKDRPPEEKSDFSRPDKGAAAPYWVVPDTQGITQGLLHLCRRSEFCRDVILLISRKTGEQFVSYLEERNYDYLVCGEEKVDFARAFDWLSDKYGVETVMVDSGPTLNRVLLEQGLMNEISLLVHPILVGNPGNRLLSDLAGARTPVKLQLLDSSQAGAGTVMLRYKVVYETQA